MRRYKRKNAVFAAGSRRTNKSKLFKITDLLDKAACILEELDTQLSKKYAKKIFSIAREIDNTPAIEAAIDNSITPQSIDDLLDSLL